MSEYIATVTVNNIADMKFSAMLNALKPYVLQEVPEGILGDPEAYREVERLLGRLANLYSYLMYLYAHVSNEVVRAKHAGDGVRQEMHTRKKDALYELARGVKYKHNACSRMLTAALGQEDDVFERADIPSRVEKAGKRKMKGWGSVS